MAALGGSVELGDGRRAAYEVIGEGEPILYFQGGPGLSAALLREDAKLLSDRLSIYLIDPHGSGGSTPPSDLSAYDHVGHARFYDAVRRALGLDEVTVMGFSFGATVALTYAALFPEVARRCVSIAARGVGVEKQDHEQAEETEQFLARHAQAPWYPRARKVWDQWTERVLAAADAAAEVDAMMAEILPLYTADPDLPRVRAVIDGWRGGVRADLRAVKAWEGGLWQTIDIRSLLPRIACPTLLLVGELDLISGPSQASLLSTALPRAQASMRLRTVARQSGYPRAQELFERLREQHFLADLQRSAQDRHRLLIATTRSEPTQASAEEQREASAMHVSQRPEVVLV